MELAHGEIALKIIECTTQAEFVAAVKQLGVIAKLLAGIFELETSGTEAPQIIVTAKASLTLWAWGSSTPHVVAWGSSTPHVVAWGSSTPHVVARGSSTPHVVASGYVHLSLFGRVIATASAKVTVLIRGKAEVTGGQQTRIEIQTAADWCEYYGVSVVDGVATLYKALTADYLSPHGTSYAPGAIPVADDWDGGMKECGGGLHFSPTPQMARAFHDSATRYAACQVALADMRLPKDEDQYPDKTKARGCCAPCAEVTADGKPVATEVAA